MPLDNYAMQNKIKRQVDKKRNRKQNTHPKKQNKLNVHSHITLHLSSSNETFFTLLDETSKKAKNKFQIFSNLSSLFFVKKRIRSKAT